MIKLSLAPVSYFWAKEQLLDFYQQIKTTPVDIVYLGETICAKRRQMRPQDWLNLAQELQAAGKEVILSTLTLIEANSELSNTRKICQQSDFMVETNDMGAVQMLLNKQPFVSGHSVNIYNHRSLDLLAKQGLKRWVMPVELSHNSLNDILKAKSEHIETEIFAYGKLPLAYSARCYTARNHNLAKDDCQFVCLDYEEGLLLKTQEQQQFLSLNGIQTQSAKKFNIMADLARIKTMPIDILRISPQARHTPEIIQIFADALAGDCDTDSAQARLTKLENNGFCDGYWYGEAGMDMCESVKM